MSDFRSDIKNTSFVKSPADAVVDLYEQYVHDLGYVLDRHAPLISRLTNKDSTDWMSDDYRCAKSLGASLRDVSSHCLVQCTCKQG